MDLSTPYSVVLSKNDGGVLKVLARSRLPLSGREVARLGGGPKTTVARSLTRLVEHGLVEAQEAGSGVVTLYTLNREHLAAEPVLALLDLRQFLFQRLTREFKNWQVPPAHASVFGSTARGDGNTDSDVDIFLVRPADVGDEDPGWRRQVYDLQGRILNWTGNHAGIVEISMEELERLTFERPPVVVELERDAVTLLGPTTSEIFRAVAG